jgi:5-methylcytosine-specific restriction endonuclease McrA
VRADNVGAVLRLDAPGRPIEWIGWQQAVSLIVGEQVLWNTGCTLMRARGGRNRHDGSRSHVDVPAVIATVGRNRNFDRGVVPTLTNERLFRRDGHLCLYCGGKFPAAALTRDHIVPVSRGGANVWDNVCSACARCNHHKGARTPGEAGMELIALPYTPSHAEGLVLSQRRILADQMEFLAPHAPRFRD